MTTSEIVTVILTSAVISGVVAFLLNYFFESRQRNYSAFHRFINLPKSYSSATIAP